MKKLLFATALVAALTTGCTSVPATPTDTAPAGSNQPAGVPASAAAPAEQAPASSPATSTRRDEGVATFGSAFEWGDGLALTVGAPEPYQPSKYAAAGTFENHVVFEMRVVNNTGAAWDPAMLHATIQSANQEGSRVFDSEQLPPEPTTKLLNGREVTFKMAFGVADPSDLVLEVTPDWDHESVIFHG